MDDAGQMIQDTTVLETYETVACMSAISKITAIPWAAALS